MEKPEYHFPADYFQALFWLIQIQKYSLNLLCEVREESYLRQHKRVNPLEKKIFHILSPS